MFVFYASCVNLFSNIAMAFISVNRQFVFHSMLEHSQTRLYRINL